MAKENANCLWHDIICLQDEQTVTFICKTLLQLAEETGAEELLKIEAVEVGSGEMVLQGLLKAASGENEKLEVKLPFIKEEIELGEVNYFQINYLQGQLLADKLWVESVVSGRIENDERKQEVVLGEIVVKENLALAENEAACERIIATHLCSLLEETTIEDGNKLILRGKHKIGLLYEGTEISGERLYVYWQDCPFREEIELSHTLEEVALLVLPYRILTAQQLTERQINIEGAVVIRAAEAEEEKIESEANSKGKQRISSRHNLAKYMRELDSIVNEEKTLRNFDLQDK